VQIQRKNKRRINCLSWQKMAIQLLVSSKLNNLKFDPSAVGDGEVHTAPKQFFMQQKLEAEIESH
jgi:hypothetical protein